LEKKNMENTESARKRERERERESIKRERKRERESIRSYYGDQRHGEYAPSSELPSAN
jgi:hypothetical protein